MWTITLISFLLITFWIGIISDEDFAEVLPVSVGGLLLLLYILGLCKNMNFVSVIAITVSSIFMAALLLMGKSGREMFFKELGKFYLNPRSVVIVAGLVIVTVLTSAHVASWWDDINYWATDVKALYFLNGFAAKYGNVAPEFGDYPPMVQIAKWCIAKINPREYKEGLAFGGYYLANLIFSLPLLKCLKGKKAIASTIGFILMLLLPGICNEIWSHGSCTDVTMGLVYGALLISMTDINGHKRSFYYGRLAILFSVLTLTKSVGFEWAIFAAVFLMVFTNINRRELKENYGKRYILNTVIVLLTVVSVQLSWWIYCLVNRRIAKLTSSGIRMVSKGYNFGGILEHKLKIFNDAFVSKPMNSGSGGIINLSTLTLIVILILSIILLQLFKKAEKKETLFLVLYSLATAVISYGIIFIGHISIFAGETQYETPEIMAISLARYGAPYTIGMLMLVIYMLTEEAVRMATTGICLDRKGMDVWLKVGIAAFILFTTDYSAASRALFTYRHEVAEDKALREEMLEESGRLYTEEIKGKEELWGKRILFLRDGSVPTWVHNAYINHEASPVATVYDVIMPSGENTKEIGEIIRKSHACYIYVEELQNSTANRNFEKKMQSFMHAGEAFRYGKLYEIFYTDNKISLGKFIAK